MYSQLQLRVWQSECDAERDYAIENGNGPDFNLYSVADVLIIFCLLAFACLRAPQPYYRKFGRVIISRGRILTGEDKSYSSSFLHGNNLSMNVIPNWVFQSFCVSLRLTELFNSSRQGRVLYCVSFVTIVLGLGWVRRCDSSTCKGIDATVYLFCFLQLIVENNISV